MRILIDIGHPAHVHYFRNFARIMQEKGHQIYFTTVEKEFEPYLLEKYGFAFKKIRKHRKGMLGKIFELIRTDFRLWFYSLKIRPDIFLGAGSISASHVAFLMRKPFIQLEDTGNMEQIRLYRPFTTLILTPDVFHKDLGKKQFRYKGYQELCYMHPKYFKPDPEIFKHLGIKKGEKYFILRFISWHASHDFGLKGITLQQKLDLVKELSGFGRVFISSERELPEELSSMKLSLPPEKLHDALAEARLYIGEGGTTATECAISGVPNILINPMAKNIGNHIEMQNKYDIQYFYDTLPEALPKIREIIRDENYIEIFREKSLNMVREMINVTDLLVWIAENYPQSLKELYTKPEIIKRFNAN